MFDCSPRRLHKIIGCTPPDICANTYQDVFSASKDEKVDICPFISCDRRITSYISRDAVVFPGPGQYDTQLPPKHIEGGNSISNHTPRFTKKNWIDPTPTPIDLPSLGNGKRQQPRTGKMVRGRPTLRELTESPSVAETGALFREQFSKNGKSNVDVCFNPIRNDKYSAIQYRGPYFSSSPRFSQKTEFSPGPGDYDPYACDPVNAVHEDQALQQIHRRHAKIRRYLDDLTVNECKEGTPGVGQYYIKRDFEECSAAKNGSFAREKRFKPRKEMTFPGPADYNNPSLGLSQKKGFRNCYPGFLSTSPRFTDDIVVKPGPGSYNIGRRKSCYCFPSFVHRDAFGSSAPRKFVNDAPNDVNPAPNEYFPQIITEPLKSQQNAVFISKTERLSCGRKNILGPGCYNVSPAFDFISKRQDHRLGGGGIFLTSERRYQLPHDVRVEPRDISVPGPGTYTLPMKKAKRGPTIPKASRFPKPPRPSPGPAAYTLSCAYRNTVRSPTFNAFLGGKPMRYFRRNTCGIHQGSKYLKVLSLEDQVC